MNTLYVLVLATMITVSLASCGAVDGTPIPLDKKLDPSVEQALARGESASVLVLGTRQLLAFPDGFTEATQRWSDTPRQELQAIILETLKTIAAEEQAAMQQLVGDRGTSLWMINSIAGRFSSDEIQHLIALPSVRHIYAAGSLPPSATGHGVASIVEPGPRTPFTHQGKVVPWNVERIGARRVWDDLGITGEGSIVAMFDAGVNYQHEELVQNIWINEDEIPNNGLDDDGNGYIDDLYGFNFGTMNAEVGASPGAGQHGSWTSGIVAGSGVGGIQTGLAPRARIMPLKATDLVGAILAYQYALENGADVINMSFSRPNLGNVRGLWRLIAEQATIAGLVSVSGAGNFQQSQPIPVQQRTPEDIPSVISVGGVDSLMVLVRFSSMGPVSWTSVRFYEDHPSLIKPDVSAFPGPGYPIIHQQGFGYVDPNLTIQGNSFSGPHGAGVAALMLSANPDLPAWRVKMIMEETAHDIAPVGKDNRTGAGLIDAFAAVQAAMNE